jgi:hypothetical protein
LKLLVNDVQSAKQYIPAVTPLATSKINKLLEQLEQDEGLIIGGNESDD